MTVEEFESITGRGVSGTVGGRTYYAGNEALLDEHGIAVGEELRTAAERMAGEAKPSFGSPMRSGRWPWRGSPTV